VGGAPLTSIVDMADKMSTGKIVLSSIFSSKKAAPKAARR
jgi:hypothetical protein